MKESETPENIRPSVGNSPNSPIKTPTNPKILCESETTEKESTTRKIPPEKLDENGLDQEKSELFVKETTIEEEDVQVQN